MYIRIEFEDLESKKTKETLDLFFSSPNGICLTSLHGHRISPSNEIKEKIGNSVVFWHLDVDILNKYWSGTMNSLISLLKFPGVSSIDILPVEGHYDSYRGKFDELVSILDKYVDGVKDV